LVRAALRYVSTQDSKAVIADLKRIYQAATPLEAESALEAFAQAWDAKYPTITKMWRAKWTDIVTLFDFPAPIRKTIYTTNNLTLSPHHRVNLVILPPAPEAAARGPSGRPSLRSGIARRRRRRLPGDRRKCSRASSGATRSCRRLPPAFCAIGP